MAPRVRTAPRKTAAQDRSKATVEAILAATARVLVKEGYDRASTNRIAEAAGVSVGSVYQYFPSKEALVAALVDRHVDEMLALVRESAPVLLAAPLPVAARTIVEVMIAAHRVDPTLHKVLFEQLPRVGRLEHIYAIEHANMQLARAYIAAHERELEIADPELAAFVVVHTIESLTHWAVVLRPDLLRDDRLIGEITRVVVRYLSPTKDL